MPATRHPQITVRPSAVGRVLVVVIATLVAVHLVVAVLHVHVAPYPGSSAAIRVLNMDGETNVPAVVATMLLFVVAGLCALLWRTSPPGRAGGRRHWLGLAVVMAFLALDEGAVIHEELSRPVARGLGLDEEEWGFWAWVVPYALGAVALACVYVPFVLRLPGAVLARLAAAGGLYVAGAAGMELVGRELFTPDVTLTYLVAVGAEETLELVGIALAVVGLLHALRLQVGPVLVRWERDRLPAPATPTLASVASTDSP